MTDELWRWDATAQAQAIRTRRISSREAVASALARLDRVNPRLNAVVDVLREDALAAADRADAAVRQGAALGPLHGVPVTFKINADYAGRATTSGVVAFKDRIAPEDGPPVANWRRAGAVAIGRTNVPAFCARFFTDNDLHGRTLNPWDATRTPGGSTGGGAAAVAVGIGALAQGSDRAGSIRYPAYACGVFGLRPSFGRVPDFHGTGIEPSIHTHMSAVAGPLARSIRDLRLGLGAMAARDPRDPWWVPAPLDQAAVRPVRVAMVANAGAIKADPAVVAAVRQAAHWLEDAGYVVEEASPPHLDEAADLFFTLVRTEERAGTTKMIEEQGDAALRRARASTMNYAVELDLDGYVKALARRSTILREWLLFCERYPLLLMPVCWERPFPIDFDQQGDAAVRRMMDAHHPMLAVSVLGLPGLSVPTGLAEGVPVGVQLVAGRFQEETCLAAGEVLEARTPIRLPIDPVI